MGWAKYAKRCDLVRLTLAAAIAVLVIGGTICPTFGQERLNIEGLRAPVAVARDDTGIVHVFATNEEDLALAQGWVHARDRLFQMDVFRRQASGTLAELLGQAALPSDVEMRTLGLRRAAACSLRLPNEGCPFNPAQGLSQATVAAVQAYAKGVNAFVAANGLPPGYAALGLTQFADWTALDSVTVAKGLAFELSFDLDDLENTEALVAYTTAGNAGGFNGEALFFEDLFRSAPFEPVAVIPSMSFSATPEAATAGKRVAASKKSGAGRRGQGAAADMGRRYLARVRKIPMLKGASNSIRLSRGSNAWVISGAKTAGSGALLANDPHLDLTTPSLFYPIHLSAPPSGVDAVGDGFAGVPFILTGRNLRIACGITAVALDVTDFYSEQVLPDADSPSGIRISHQPPDDALDRIIPIPEIFRFRDQNGGIVDAPPGTVPQATLVLARRNFGPLLDDPGDGESLSVQYTGFSPTRELDAARLLMIARNMNDVAASLQFSDVASHSLTCADSAGSISYFAPGEVPLREDLQAGAVNGLPPYFIRNGLVGNDWLPMPNPPENQAVPFQILPASEMPQVIDPPEGYIVSANNDPLGLTFDNDPLNTPRPGSAGIYYLSSRFNPGLRAFRINQLLDRSFENGSASFENMRDIQADVVLRDAQVFLPFLIRAFDNALNSGLALANDPAVSEAVGRLRVWDGSTPTGVEEGYDASDEDGELRPPSPNEQAASVAATIYSMWRGQFVRRTVLQTLTEVGLRDFDPSSQQVLTALRNLLDRFPERGGIGASGLNFFNVPGIADPALRRDTVILESLKFALELLKSPAFAPAFAGSANQGDYKWGRLHRLLIDHPLGDDFSLTGDRQGNPFRPPFADLPGLPVDGGLETVDAANHTSRANSLQDFEFRQGPLRRFVSSMGGSRRTESSLPGGVSEDPLSPFFNNLLGPWLTNETFRWRHVPLGAIQSKEVVILTPRQSASP